ncbi:hypothetical protein MYP_633 [Sporocytophaga myxococcoides]|uniref:Lipoprotein n=1 Tax=Sporocytophaga myxococcoides TaxID=153721 RepID=A0A098L948_9BACT|nr:hypothetical protein [Sporocytophaga myxococcoides]GAL83406.1 hypothetical protein MYP_633 [Sporocytophaga myxococcoides]
MVLKRLVYFCIFTLLTTSCGLFRNNDLSRGERKLNRLLKRYPELKKDSIVKFSLDTIIPGYTKESTSEINEDTASVDEVLKLAMDSIVQALRNKYIPKEQYDSLIYIATVKTRNKLSKIYKENFIKDTLVNEYPDLTVKTWTENGILKQSVNRADIAVHKEAEVSVPALNNKCPGVLFYEGKYFIEFLLGIIFSFFLLLFLILRKL